MKDTRGIDWKGFGWLMLVIAQALAALALIIAFSYGLAHFIAKYW